MPGPLNTITLSFCLATSSTASAGAETATSMIASTFPVSNHSRALLEAMSALFWWSAVNSSIFLPSTWPPKSSMAIWMAATLPGPVMSAKGPLRSLRMPTRTTSSEIWAMALAPAKARTALSAARAHWRSGNCREKRRGMVVSPGVVV